jgi:histidinol phosphatase-like PHP family hydrolase
MKTNHDVHMHTSLSLCAKEKSLLLEGITEKAKPNSLGLPGFSDHIWDKTITGGDDAFYVAQGNEHVSLIRAMLPEKIEGIKVLVGCETEYLGKGLTGMSKKTAGLFDYVLVLTNHNLTGFAKKEKLDTEENRQ